MNRPELIVLSLSLVHWTSHATLIIASASFALGGLGLFPPQAQPVSAASYVFAAMTFQTGVAISQIVR